VKKTVYAPPGANPETTWYVYNDQGLMAELDEIGNPTDFYLFPPDGLWSTDPILRKSGSSYYYYQTDHLGTPQQLIDATGSIVHSREMRAFGETNESGIADRWRFPGQVESAETGFHHNFFREYVASLGRYATVDPLHLRGSMNFYGYAGQNSILHKDPLGLLFDDWIDPSNPLPDMFCLYLDFCPEKNEIDLPRLPSPPEPETCKAKCRFGLLPICRLMGSGFGLVCIIPGGALGNAWGAGFGLTICAKASYNRCMSYIKRYCEKECEEECE
jgi:RHS repeat-associated protein